MKPFFIMGPCIIENRDNTLRIAEYVDVLRKKHGVDIVFKASFSKENRTSGSSFRGVGNSSWDRMRGGLTIFKEIKDAFGLRITTDIHSVMDVSCLGAPDDDGKRIIDILQVPAMLCRQTDILEQIGHVGAPVVNIKKSQALPAKAMKHAIEKVTAINPDALVYVTERGSSFGGQGDLVVDLRNIIEMQKFAPVIYDCTHSVQQMSTGEKSGGNRDLALPLARAVATLGVDGFFAEIHFDPDNALSDGPNTLTFDQADKLIADILQIYSVNTPTT